MTTEPVPEPVGGESFVDASGVSPDLHVPGRWHASIPVGWNSGRGVHGGMLAATVARAMAAELAEPDLALRTLHVSFLEPPGGNDLVIDTQIARRGGITAHLRAAGRGHGQDEQAVDAWALFTRPRTPPDQYLDAQPPTVPGPDDCGGDALLTFPKSPFGRPGFMNHLDLRTALGVFPWDPAWKPGAAAHYIRWSRFVVPPLDAQGGLDPLSLLVPGDLPGPSVMMRGAPDEPLLGVLSLEYTVHFLEAPTDEWLLSDFRARWMGDGYVLTEADLWSAGRLVAVASQSMLVRRMPTTA